MLEGKQKSILSMMSSKFSLKSTSRTIYVTSNLCIVRKIWRSWSIPLKSNCRTFLRMTTEAILEVGQTPGRTKQWKVIQKVWSRKREKANKSSTKRIYLRRNYRTCKAASDFWQIVSYLEDANGNVINNKAMLLYNFKGEEHSFFTLYHMVTGSILPRHFFQPTKVQRKKSKKKPGSTNPKRQF